MCRIEALEPSRPDHVAGHAPVAFFGECGMHGGRTGAAPLPLAAGLFGIGPAGRSGAELIRADRGVLRLENAA